MREERDEYEKAFKIKWAHVTQFIHGSRTFEGNLERALESEKNRKYDDIVLRTEKIVGTITDASDLKVGATGELNGFIIGDQATVKVQTIGAGGYNDQVILDSGRHGQCFHFRVLVNKVTA